MILPIGQTGVWEVNLKTNYSKDIDWCAEMLQDMITEKEWIEPLKLWKHPDGVGHIQGYGCELVLLPNGRWFMNDTSGG